MGVAAESEERSLRHLARLSWTSFRQQRRLPSFTAQFSELRLDGSSLCKW